MDTDEENSELRRRIQALLIKINIVTEDNKRLQRIIHDMKLKLDGVK
jgi:hypothetical protein